MSEDGNFNYNGPMQFFDISLLNWFSFILINATLLGSSYCIASYTSKSSSFSATLAAALMFYLAQATVIVLFFGACLKTLNPIAIGAFVLVIAGVQIFYGQKYRKPFLASISTALKTLFKNQDRWFYIIFSLLIIQVVLNLFKVVVLPVHIFDSLVYRAPPAPLWFQLDMIPAVLDVPVNDINGKALGIAVLMLWFFLFLGDSLLVNFPQFLISLVLILIVYAAARQCGASQGWSLKMTALAYFIPGVLIESVSTQDHLAVNVAFIALLFFMREWSITQDRRLIFILGVLLGLLFSFKINAVIYIPVLFLAAGYLLFEKRSIWQGKKAIGGMIKSSLIIFILAFLVGGYWMSKNVWVHGKVFGLAFVGTGAHASEITRILPEDIPVQVKEVTPQGLEGFSSNVVGRFLKWEKFFGNLNAFPERLLDHQAQLYKGNFSVISAFGPQFFSVGIMALLCAIGALFFVQGRLSGRFYVFVGLGMLLLYFCIMDNIYAYRNFIFFPVLVFIYAAVLLNAQLTERHKGPTFFVNLSMVVCLLWSGWHLLPPTYANLHTVKEFITLERHYQSAGRYTRLYGPSPKVYRILDELPRDEPLYYVNGGIRDTWIYAYYDVKWQRPVRYIPLQERYFKCNTNTLECIPTTLFKQLLEEKKGRLINMCVQAYCLRIKDPEFLEIAPGLYYFISDTLAA